jgi:hypothetical protein
VLLASTVGVGAVVVNAKGAAVLTEIVRDPLAAFGQRSPGQRRPGALFQTKPLKAVAQAPAAPRRLAAAPLAPALAPPVAQPVVDTSCEHLTAPVSAAVSAPVGPEAERVAGQLVAAVQQALAENKTAGQAQREGAVEQALQDVLETNGVKPEVAMSALPLVQARLVALGLNCGPGVPEAMQIASTAATQASQPADFQPGAISQPGPSVIGFPPAIASGGGGGGGTVYRAAPV